MPRKEIAEMALKAVLENLDGLDDVIKQLYIEHDGKYRLDVEGGFKTTEEIAGLSSALNKERDARAKLEKALKRFEVIEDPDKALQALEVVRNLDQKKLIDAGEVEKVKQEVAKAMQSKIDELQVAVDQKDAMLVKELIGGRFARSKFIQDKIVIPPDMVEARFGANFKIEEGRVIAYDQHGNKIYSRENPGDPADFEEALQILVDAYPYKDSILKGSSHTGSGTTSGGTNQRASAGDWHKLPPAERLDYARRAGFR